MTEENNVSNLAGCQVDIARAQIPVQSRHVGVVGSNMIAEAVGNFYLYGNSTTFGAGVLAGVTLQRSLMRFRQKTELAESKDTAEKRNCKKD